MWWELPVDMVRCISEFLPYIDILRMEVSCRTFQLLVARSLLHHHFARRLLTKLTHVSPDHTLRALIEETQLPFYAKLQSLFASRLRVSKSALYECPQLHVLAYTAFSHKLPLTFSPLPWPKFEYHQWLLTRICDKAYHHYLLGKVLDRQEGFALDHDEVRKFYSNMPLQILALLLPSYQTNESQFFDGQISSPVSACCMCNLMIPATEMKYEKLCLFCSRNPRLHHEFLKSAQKKRKRS